jgi:prepilin-type N-terminal cleavage/methylation domain-containing protein
MKKGFTLIELLIVIGILAILATAVVLVINPAELLAQARDSRRISDFNSIKSAIGLYAATATTVTIGAGPNSTNAAGCWFGAACSATCTVNATTSIDGTGWVAIDLRGASGGSPLASLPVDPINNATFQYAYRGDPAARTFELNANLESVKYMPLEGTDGGNCPGSYEVGTAPGLNL